MAELKTDYIANLGQSYGQGLDIASQMNTRQEGQRLKEAQLIEMRMKREDEARENARKAQADKERMIINIADAASKMKAAFGNEGLKVFSEAASNLPGLGFMKNIDPEDFELKEGKSLFHVKDPTGDYVGSLVFQDGKMLQFKASTPSKKKPNYTKISGKKIDLPGGKSMTAPAGYEMDAWVNEETGDVAYKSYTKSKAEQGGGAAKEDEIKTGEMEKIEKYAQEYIVGQWAGRQQGGDETLAPSVKAKDYMGAGGMGALSTKDPALANMVLEITRMAKEIYKKGRKKGATPQQAVMEAYQGFLEVSKSMMPSHQPFGASGAPPQGAGQPAGDNDPLGLRGALK